MTTHEEIEQILNNISISIRGIDQELEKLSGDGIISFDDDELIYRYLGQLRGVSIQLNKLLAAMLDPSFSSSETRKLLKQSFMLNVLKDNDNIHSPLGRFLKQIGDVE